MTVVHPLAFHTHRTIHSKTRGGMAPWREIQVKEGRRIVGRFKTLQEAFARFPGAVATGGWNADETTRD